MKAILAVVLILSGCAHYTKPGGSSTEFENDYYQCQRDSAPVADQWRRIAMEDRCLKSKGWRQ